MAQQFNLTWVKHLPKEEQEDFKKLVLNSRLVLTRLHDILTEELRILESEETDLKNYELPGWDYKQAHLNGKKAALKKIDQLLL